MRDDAAKPLGDSKLLSLLDSTRRAIPPIHPAGYPFIAIGVALTLLLWLFGGELGWIGVVLTLYVAFFFRDPIRTIPVGSHLFVAPADGRVTAVDRAVPPPELGLGDAARPCVSIFLSVFDVHVNRAPIGGRISRIAYRPGKFLNAELDKASEDNERNALVIESARGPIAVVQIAGFVARRIVCFAREGQELATGERFGLIRFGSRLDVFLPDGAVPLVGLGQTAVAGETVIADLGRADAPRGFWTS